MAMDSFIKFRNCLLDTFRKCNEKDEYCELEVHCSDGKLSIQGLIFAYLCSYIDRKEITSAEDHCVFLPDVCAGDLITFLRCLFSADKEDWDTSVITKLVHVGRTIGVAADGVTNFSPEAMTCTDLKSTEGDDHRAPVAAIKPAAHSGVKHPRRSRVVVNPEPGVATGNGLYTELSGLALFLDERSAVAPSSSGNNALPDKKCLLKLSEISIDTVTDDVLTENFCDQEGRLVCLVCYKIMGPSDFGVYRAHVKDHDSRQLEKVTVSLPDIGRGGPGLRKNPTSDADLEREFLEPGGEELRCKKCGKRYRLEEKAGFRKHLNYHAHKEKNYVYVCSQCSKAFSDHSNLKRHVQSVHEKQVFRCLHCDFEDKKKKKLEDHLMQVHKERDLALNKDCNFKTRREEEVEAHIRENHADTSASIKRIALKPKEPKFRIHVCETCNDVFKKRALLIQHLWHVHGLEQASDFVCGQCDIKCASLSGLRAHERAHLEKKFSCGSCNKSFLLLSLLKDHLERKSCAVETRTCHLCNKIFSDRIRKEIHLKTHYKDKAFVCNICGKGFIQKRSLKEHQLTHEPVRRFECRHCGKQFVQHNHLRYHLASQHPDLVSQDEGSQLRRHNCPHCAKTFPFAYQLKRHERVHGLMVKSSLQCGACLNWFSSPTLLREHQESSCFVLTYETDDQRPGQMDVEGGSSGAGSAAIEVILASEEAGVVVGGSEDSENYVDRRWGEGEIIVTSEDLEVENSLSQMEVAPV